MGLRAKFNLVMLAALILGLGLSAALSYGLVQTNAREQVLAEADILDSQASAIAAYTATEIAPVLADQMARRFLPQSIPAWATHTNFERMQKTLPEYRFNAVVVNPTNPADSPADWQAAIIDQLRQAPGTQRLVTERETPAGGILSVSHPIIITNPACLQCHSVPSAAPASMIDLYGRDHGFGWKLNEVIGAQIVSVPTRVAYTIANQTFQRILIQLAAVFLVMIVMLNLLLHYVIIKPVRGIATRATAVSMGDMDGPELAVRGRDEISALAEAFNRMRRSLANAMKLLGE